MHYVVTNTREESVTVDGLAVLPPGAFVVVSEEAAAAFRYTRGIPLAQGNVPDGVKVEILVGGEA